MKILVAGGAGYVGSALVPYLVERGYEVEVIDLLWFGNRLPDSVQVVQKDLFCCKEKDLEGFDQVIFLAGLSNDPMAEYNPSANFIHNGALPSYLAYMARRAGVKRFIYGSSCSVYGYTVNELYDEESPVISGYPYGISKLQGERGVIQMHGDGFSTIALRKGTISGYSPRMRMDLIVNTMFKCAMKDRKIVVNNAAIWRPILDMRDAIRGYLRALQADYSINGIFNITSDNYTVGQVGDLVKEELEELGEHVGIEIRSVPDYRNYKVTSQKARTVLGYEPKYTIADIVRDLYEHRKEFGDYEDDNFYNIRQFRKLEI